MDDLISRQSAIDALDAICDRECEYPKKQRAVMCGACRLGSAFDAIDELPSAERRGQWIKDKNLYKCTACNDLLTVAGWADCIPEKQIYTAFKYCPNCGAKMSEVENE